MRSASPRSVTSAAPPARMFSLPKRIPRIPTQASDKTCTGTAERRSADRCRSRGDGCDVVLVCNEVERRQGRRPAKEMERYARPHAARELGVDENELGADPRVRVIVDGVRRRRHRPVHRQTPAGPRSLERLSRPSRLRDVELRLDDGLRRAATLRHRPDVPAIAPRRELDRLALVAPARPELEDRLSRFLREHPIGSPEQLDVIGGRAVDRRP